MSHHPFMVAMPLSSFRRTTCLTFVRPTALYSIPISVGMSGSMRISSHDLRRASILASPDFGQ
ncbi:hypothetical protein HY68_37535 [Streptomyces sp. AcH 505]|nr:hypothetical protein HY68_37535 [Streptomyces sp. AcH 505]